jgi:uncharacterized protein (TIRG00374 family)
MQKRLRIFLKVATTALLLCWILFNVDLGKLGAIFANIQPLFLVIVCLLYPAAVLICAIKLKWILDGYGVPVSLTRSIDLNWIAAFFNNFLPGTLGADIYRVIDLNRVRTGKRAQVLSTVILDRGLGMLAMLIVAAATSPFFLTLTVGTTWIMVSMYCLTSLILLLVFGILFWRHNIQIRRQPKHEAIRTLIHGINVLINYPDPLRLLQALICSISFVFLTVGSYYLLFLAFRSDVSLLLLCFAIPTVSLAGAIPLSINGLGIAEAVGIMLFSRFGFEPEIVLSIFLCARGLLILCSATGGIRYLFKPHAGGAVRSTS